MVLRPFRIMHTFTITLTSYEFTYNHNKLDKTLNTFMTHKVMHSCIHVIVTNCFLSCVLNSKDITHLLPSSHEFNVYVCMCR